MKTANKRALFGQLPSVDEVLRLEVVAGLAARYGRAAVTAAARAMLEQLREEIVSGGLDEAKLALAVDGIGQALEGRLRSTLAPSLRTVINATGVVLHTNLGRAPLGAETLERMRAIGGGYSNLEFDLASGRRGKRDLHADRLFAVLFAQQVGKAAEKLATVVVNNNAAAVLLSLNTLAEGAEAIVSRGELVEIGGSFRIPEVMAKAGVTLREVGTTNRTRISDYQRALSERTRVLLRVHRSNFQITGFTEQPPLAALVELGRKHRITVMEDLGSGALFDLRTIGIAGEPTVAESLRAGVDLVTYSGDKLLAGPQAGILTGRRELVARLRANPLFRALRVDKLTYAALESTVAAYIRGDLDSIPAVRMMRLSAEDIARRAKTLLLQLKGAKRVHAELGRGASLFGGGAAPGSRLPTTLVAITCEGLGAEEVAQALRASGPLPIIARVEEGRVLLDLRTVFPAQDACIAARLRELAGAE